MHPSSIEFIHVWDHIWIVVPEVRTECAWVDCVGVMLWFAKWVVLIVWLVEVILCVLVVVLFVWCVYSWL